MMKKLIEKLKEKWFWYRHPNLEYQMDVEDEKTMWRSWLNSKDASKLLTASEIEDCKQYLK